MRVFRHPRWSRVFVLLALLQMVAPSVAAIADAWRLDERTPYAHVESESSSACVVVHAHDCALCSIATSTGGTLEARTNAWVAPVARVVPTAEESRAIRWRASIAASPRAPPTLEG
jgi:hypothetical protein